MNEEVRRIELEEAEANATKAEAEARRAKAQAEATEAETRRAEAETRRAEAERRRLGAEAAQRAAEAAARRSTFGFRSSGDPILCAYNKSSDEVIQKSCVNYTGPAVVTCYDHDGLQKLIWVGVSNEDGSNRQGEDAWWVAETLALTVSTGKWSYEDVTGKHIADVSCDTAEGGNATVLTTPPMSFLKTFRNSKTFLVHTLQPRIIPGPKYSFMQDMLSDSKLSDLVYDEHNAKNWINALLMMLGHATEHDIRSKALGEIAKYAVVYGVSQAQKKQGTSQSQFAWLPTAVSV